jgi:solute carrier family 25 oxoglutarate transporter 11
MQIYGQINPGKPVPGFPTIFKNMIASEGMTSLYRGVDAAIGRQMVYGTARIGLHDKFSSMLVEKNQGQPISFAQKAASGMLSGAIAVSIGSPFDIALVRLQSDGMAKPADRRNYKNVFDVSYPFSTINSSWLTDWEVVWCMKDGITQNNYTLSFIF